MRNGFLQCCLLLCALGLSAPPAHPEDTNAGLRIEDALTALGFSPRIPIDLSPDGQWVAYTLQDPRRAEAAGSERYVSFTPSGVAVEGIGCDVWITDTHSGESLNLTKGKGSSWAPVWSPDGSHLAFYSDRGGQAQLWIWEKATRELRLVSDVIVRPFFGFEVVRWTPDGKSLLVKILPQGMTLEDAALLLTTPSAQSEIEKKEPGSTVVIYRSSANAKLYAWHTRIWIEARRYSTGSGSDLL